MPRAACSAPVAYAAYIASSVLGCGLTEFPAPTHRATPGGGGASPSTDSAQGAGCDGSKRFPSTPILDSFDRANGTVGTSWVGEADGFSIESGAISGDSVGGNSLYWKSSFGAEQEVYATLEAFDPALYDMSLILKAQSTSEGCPSLRVRYANGYTVPHSVLVMQCDGPVTILFDHEVPPLHSGARVGARVRSSGCIEVFAHDANPSGGEPPPFAYLGSVSAPDFSAILFPGYVGIYSQVTKSGAPGVPSVWDDFGGGEVR